MVLRWRLPPSTWDAVRRAVEAIEHAPQASTPKAVHVALLRLEALAPARVIPIGNDPQRNEPLPTDLLPRISILIARFDDALGDAHGGTEE
jgi:hypothetical protein